MSVKKRKVWLVMCLLSVLGLMFGGCSVRRNRTAVRLSNETANVFRVETGSTSLEDITEVFLGMTPDEAKSYMTNSCKSYEVNGLRLFASEKNQNVRFVAYEDDNEGAYSCYFSRIGDKISEHLCGNTMRRYFREENLDFCSKEEAIEACRPYAEACGYTDTEVSVYAVTLDKLVSSEVSAPGPGWDVVSWRLIDEMKEQGDLKAAEVLAGYKQGAAVLRGIPWEKKHEAFVLTYQPKIDGTVMQESFDLLWMIYVPLYGRPVYMQGMVPCEIKETIGEVQLISKEAALEEFCLIKGYESVDEVEVQNISLIYAPQSVTESDGTVWEKAIPCWNIEYKQSIYQYKVVIDAEFGELYQQYLRY